MWTHAKHGDETIYVDGKTRGWKKEKNVNRKRHLKCDETKWSIINTLLLNELVYPQWRSLSQLMKVEDSIEDSEVALSFVAFSVCEEAVTS